MAAERTKKWERRSETRPAELIEAALRCFSERGFAATRLDDVAARAGVSKATVYLYFENKEKLFEAVVRAAVAPKLDQAHELVDKFEGSTPDLMRSLLAILETALDGPFPAMAKLVISESGNFPELARLWVSLVLRRGFSLLERLIERGVERGEFRAVDPAVAAPLVMAPVILAGDLEPVVRSTHRDAVGSPRDSGGARRDAPARARGHQAGDTERQTMKRARALVALFALASLAGVGTWLARTGRLAHGREPSNLVTVYGNVDIRQVELGFRVPGRLKTMHFEEGEAVVAGAPLAELDTRPLEDQLRAGEAQVATDEAQLEKAIAGSRPAEIARGRAAVAEARAAQQDALIELQRTDRLVADKAIAEANHDTALAVSRQADARLASAEESLRLLVQGSRAEDIAAARATLDLARANVASARTSLDDTRLVAPSDGVILSRVREPGAIVSPNDVVYVLSLTHSVWVRAYVSETELGLLHPGMAVDVLTDAAPGRVFKGHVGFISPTAEFTPKSVETPELRTDLVYRIRVIVDDLDLGLRQGMPVTARIATGGA